MDYGFRVMSPDLELRIIVYDFGQRIMENIINCASGNNMGNSLVTRSYENTRKGKLLGTWRSTLGTYI
jgi:hypothetical protein